MGEVTGPDRIPSRKLYIARFNPQEGVASLATDGFAVEIQSFKQFRF
jgi:hypothetical protein